jgi:hypothetical protein
MPQVCTFQLNIRSIRDFWRIVIHLLTCHCFQSEPCFLLLLCFLSWHKHRIGRIIRINIWMCMLYNDVEHHFKRQSSFLVILCTFAILVDYVRWQELGDWWCWFDLQKYVMREYVQYFCRTENQEEKKKGLRH